MLHIVTGVVGVAHYMGDLVQENFMHLIDASDEDEVETIMGMYYDLLSVPYATTYHVQNFTVTSAMSMATIQDMKNAKP